MATRIARAICLCHVLVSECSGFNSTKTHDHRSLTQESDQSLSSLLAIGTSDTWGSGIGEDDPTPFTYPMLIGSTKATNLGMRASGPGYPALCLQSMVGESMHHVVIVEYMLRADEGLEILANRIRRRFPQSTLIFLDLWYPRLVRVAGSGFRPEKDSIGLEAYQKRMGYQALNDPEFVRHLQTNPHRMFINQRIDLQEIQRHVVQNVGGYVWQLPIPQREDQVGAFVAQMASLFSNDFKHLSKKGHEYVARGLTRLLRTIPRDNLSMTKSAWERQDSCASWFLSGKVPHEFDSHLRLSKFDDQAGKFALEVDPSGGSMLLHNPFLEPATLHLSYMTTGEPRKYPQTRVTVSGSAVLLNPTFDSQVHVAMTTKIGILQPGNIELRIDPVETTEWPFRMVATSITQVDLMQDLGLVNMQAVAEQQNRLSS